MKFTIFTIFAFLAASLFVNANSNSIAPVFFEHYDPDKIIPVIELYSSFATVIILAGAFTFAVAHIVTDKNSINRLLRTAVSIAGMGTTLSVPTISVLREEIGQRERSTSERINATIASEVKKQVAQLGFAENGIDEDKLLKQISDRLDEKLAEISREGDIEETANSFKRNIAFKAAGQQFESIKGNLIDYRESNRKQYSLNLRMGLLLGLSSILIVLYLLIFGRNDDFVLDDGSFSAMRMVSFYVPWITIILIVQYMAAFFLRLYRENVVTERYLRDEITTVGFKVSGVETALLMDNQTTIKAVIEQLLETDRHVILSKDQRSVEVEKAKMEQQNFKESLTFLSKLYPSQFLENIQKTTSNPHFPSN